MHCTDIQITLTQKEKDDYLSHGIGPAEKMVPVYSGIELEPFLASGKERGRMRAYLGLGDGDIVAGTVARLVPIKNHELLIAAASVLRDKIPQLKFVFVGDGELRETLEQRVKTSGLMQRFIFTGWRNDIVELLTAFDIFVMCSRNEGQGRAFVEAQASGVPAVGTRVGGVPEVLDEGKTGLLVDPGDSQGLARALERLAGDNGLRKRMAAACRPWVMPRFAASVMVDSIERIYLQLLDKRHNP
jgi:glycosyltransferase involved in cell wall biosynthesis